MNDVEIAQVALELAKKIQEEVPRFKTPLPDTAASISEMVFAHSLVKDTRGYIERIAHQINGSYGSGWYDACAVMLRRLVETLIIETFESYRIESKIKKPDGDYHSLDELVTAALNESSWSLGRDTKRALPRLKGLGNRSAHSRRFIAHKGDIDRVIQDIRVVVQELVFLARLQ